MALEKTDYIWFSGKLVKWDEAMVHVLTHTLHYGGGAFEGIRVYNGEQGPAIFRLAEHMDRLVSSAQALKMDLPWDSKTLAQATKELVAKNKLKHGYIRPIAFLGYGIMGLRPAGAPIEVAIACWPWGAYLPHDAVDVKVSSYIRIHQRSTEVEAKLCGHYVNSILANLELRGTEYHEALLLDADGNIAEGPGENLFIIKDKKLYTPKRGTILAGITRATLMELARDKGYTVEEKTLRVEDVYGADEAFFTGTAAEVTPIRSLDKKVLGNGGVGPITGELKQLYQDVVVGKVEKYRKYLTLVNEK